jgi:hypothetical protein
LCETQVCAVFLQTKNGQKTARSGSLGVVATGDDLTWHLESASADDPIARFRRTALDAHAVFKALAFQDSLSGLRDAVMALDETGAKRALIAAAMERHSREVSAKEHFNWMRAGGRLDLDFFKLD